MNSRLTIAVLLILIILVGIVAYVSRQPKPSAHPSKNQYVFTPHPTSLQRISYKPASGPELAFKHVGTHWLIVSPIKARGRDYAIGDLASTLADLKWRYRNRISSSGSHTLAQTGLEKPKAVLTVVNQSGKTFTLNIGSQNATGRLYVHVSGSHNPYIDVVKADWLSRLDRPVRKFRNRSLTSFHTRNIAKITLNSAGRIIQIVPHGKGWLLTKPLLAPAATSAVTNWISNLQLLTAHRFSSVPASRAGFKNGPLTITVAFKPPHPLPAVGGKNKAAASKPLPAPTPLVINFGIKTDLTGKFYYAESSYNPGVCVVRNTSFTQMNQSFNKLRDHHLVAADVATEASKITITRRIGVTGNTPALLTLGKISGKWVLNTSPTQRETADSAVVSKLLTDLHSVTAKRFIDAPRNLTALGLSRPSARWNITLTGHIHPIEIAFGTLQKSGLMPVKLAQWPSVYLVSPAAVKELLPQLTALRSKTVADLTGDKIQRIALRHAGQTVALQHVSGKWLLNTKTPAAVAAVNNLLAAWKPLQAKKWFINTRMVSSVPPITMDVTLLHFNNAVPATAPATKKPAASAKAQAITQHDVLTLWNTMIPTKPAASKKTATTKQTVAKTQWRAELVQTGQAPQTPAWIFQPKSSLVSAVQSLLKPQK
ncbi:MAG: DUF4340 domain-containing protein [Phycisphaerae bacterium]